LTVFGILLTTHPEVWVWVLPNLLTLLTLLLFGRQALKRRFYAQFKALLVLLPSPLRWMALEKHLSVSCPLSENPLRTARRIASPKRSLAPIPWNTNLLIQNITLKKVAILTTKKDVLKAILYVSTTRRFIGQQLS